MEYLYCEINFPAQRKLERIKLDVNFNENTESLKERIKNEILKTKNCEISLMYWYVEEKE